jgi:hypothetical protein
VETQTATDYELSHNAAGLGVFAKRAYRAHERVSVLEFGPARGEPWRHSVQCGLHQHAEPLPEYLRYLNHSCAPNTFLDIEAGCVVALRELRIEEELTFFYPSTEWIMQSPFECACAAPHCQKQIRGAAFIPTSVLLSYRLSPVVSQLLALRAHGES